MRTGLFVTEGSTWYEKLAMPVVLRLMGRSVEHGSLVLKALATRDDDAVPGPTGSHYRCAGKSMQSLELVEPTADMADAHAAEQLSGWTTMTADRLLA